MCATSRAAYVWTQQRLTHSRWVPEVANPYFTLMEQDRNRTACRTLAAPIGIDIGARSPDGRWIVTGHGSSL